MLSAFITRNKAKSSAARDAARIDEEPFKNDPHYRLPRGPSDWFAGKHQSRQFDADNDKKEDSARSHYMTGHNDTGTLYAESSYPFHILPSITHAQFQSKLAAVRDSNESNELLSADVLQRKATGSVLLDTVEERFRSYGLDITTNRARQAYKDVSITPDEWSFPQRKFETKTSGPIVFHCRKCYEKRKQYRVVMIGHWEDPHLTSGPPPFCSPTSPSSAPYSNVLPGGVQGGTAASQVENNGNSSSGCDASHRTSIPDHECLAPIGFKVDFLNAHNAYCERTDQCSPVRETYNEERYVDVPMNDHIFEQTYHAYSDEVDDTTKYKFEIPFFDDDFLTAPQIFNLCQEFEQYHHPHYNPDKDHRTPRNLKFKPLTKKTYLSMKPRNKWTRFVQPP
ncbi:MAG: hypothetical protein SGILL_006242, partial [Bacillariaceae sp.]